MNKLCFHYNHSNPIYTMKKNPFNTMKKTASNSRKSPSKNVIVVPSQPTIVWKNRLVYNHSDILNHIKFVRRNMNGLLPVNSTERSCLAKYAKSVGVPESTMMSISNFLKIQATINAGSVSSKISGQISNRFIELVSQQEISNEDLNKFLISRYSYTNKKGEVNRVVAPYKLIIDSIIDLPEFDLLTAENMEFLKKTRESIARHDLLTAQMAANFERMVEDYLRTNYPSISFRTEEEIRRDSPDGKTPTPDILFDKDVVINLNGRRHTIRWLDAKNYALVNSHFIMDSLAKQSDKYNKAYGKGAFIFRNGFDESVQIPYVPKVEGETPSNVLKLDGSMIPKLERQLHN